MDQPFQSRRNRLLELLPASDFDRLRPHLHDVSLDYRFELYGAGKPIPFVYFPVTGVASIVNTMMDGSAAEVGTVGNEGMVGLPVILGDTVAPNDVYVQVPGTGLRMPANVFRETLEGSSTMRTVMLHYVHALFNQIAQSAACNNFHTIEQRCCRWLLMTHDRVHSDQFTLTQEFLGMMLGVRRTSITLTANQLKRRGLIKYSRGHVTVLDRPGLERGSCECYAVSKREFDRLLGPPQRAIAGAHG
jgi:CRP-like cAMP-binding protein